MIVTEIYDGQGLGNQLWCYVTTRVIAKDLGFDFGIQSPNKFKCKDFLELDLGIPVFGGDGPEGGPPRILPDGIQYYYQEKKITHPENDADIRTFDKNLLTISDNTKIDGVMQDERYIEHRKDEIRQWLKIKEGFDCQDYASDQICVINFRGGGYVFHKDLFLTQKYWDDAVAHMKRVNRDFKFIVITDDTKTAKKFFPNFNVFHFSISKDYAIIKNAHYLILSNSSFACFPAWLNENLKLCIAPKYWARHNTSDGYWACGYNIMKGWTYLDREGKLTDSDTCIKELREYEKNHKEYYTQKKIQENFLVISDYFNDISWVPEYTDNYIIYDRSNSAHFYKNIDQKKVVKSPNLGYNSYDYFTYIIDNYDSLPECIVFAKGHSFPRHVRKTHFDRVMNNRCFTPIEDWKVHAPEWPKGFFSPDGGFCEINKSRFLNSSHPVRYFNNYNDFLKFCYKDPVIPRYTRFAPGGDYIVPKANILKLPKVFYENLRMFMSHHQVPGETHIIERAMHTLWSSNFELSKKMLIPLSPDMPMVERQDWRDPFDSPSLSYKKMVLGHIRSMIPIPLKKTIRESFGKTREVFERVRFESIKKKIGEIFYPEKELLSPATIVAVNEYRKGIKIYDIFNFFNELELLDLRLNILDKHVDYFVIVESRMTHSGMPKKLYYEENKKLFDKFNHKIIHLVIESPLKDFTDAEERRENSKDSFDRDVVTKALSSSMIKPGVTSFLRDFYEKEYVKKALVGLSDDDFCYVSDLDEIWNPEVIIDYRKNDIFKFRQIPYYYYLNNRSDQPWAGTIGTRYENIKNSCLNHVRSVKKTKHTYIKNGGWHFTYQGGEDRVAKKIKAFSHQEFNTPDIMSRLSTNIKSNQDYIGRGFKFWIEEKNLPKYILENKEKYQKFFK